VFTSRQVARSYRASTWSSGGIVEKEAPLHLSNIALVDPKTGEATRVGFKFLTDGRKVRYARRSGEVIDL
jgi:large subunit ribosomal protein L24